MKKIYLFKVKKRVLLWLAVLFITVIVLVLSVSNLASNRLVSTWFTGIYASDDELPDSTVGREGKLAIIIDDFGSDRDGVEEMMAITRDLTFAVMPFLDYSEEDAISAYGKGFEVIVHLSMEPIKGKKSWLGPNPIMADMEPDEVMEVVLKALENIPHAVGANIHMGSKASSREDIMDAVLDVIKEKDMYFVDSRTAEHPIGKKIAEEKGVLGFDRDVFIDGQQPKSFIVKRLRQAGDISLKNGTAIAIGHVGIEGGKKTAEAICDMLPEFDEKNIHLVFVSALQ